MRPDWPQPDVKTPFYGTWWFFIICFLGIIYAATVVAIPVLEKKVQARLNPPIKIMYRWTGEDGVPHYSSTKPDFPAEQIPYKPKSKSPTTMDKVETKTLKVARKLKPALGPILIVFIAAVIIVRILKGTLAFTIRMKQKLTIKSFESALGECIHKADEFGASLRAEHVDKNRYIVNLGQFRNALENLSERPLALDYHYRTIVEHLRSAYDTYTDCLSLWDIESQRDIVYSDRNVFINKYPTLLDRTTGIDKPLPTEEVQKAAMGTLWKYAEGYIIQAGRLFERLSSPEAQSGPESK